MPLEKGTLFVWGSNSEGQIGLGKVNEQPSPLEVDIGEKVLTVSCGYYHTAIITGYPAIYTICTIRYLIESGRLLTCGETDGGKLGFQASKDNRTFESVEGRPSIDIHVHGINVHKRFERKSC